MVKSKILVSGLLLVSLLANAQVQGDYWLTDKISGKKLEKQMPLTFTKGDQPFENEVMIFVDPERTFQTMEGIGGAITDATAETYAKLSKERQEQFVNLYFDRDEGIHYTFLRTNINSCDFSSDMYTYVEEGDKELKTFSLAHDEKFKIPLLQEIFKKNNQVKLFASPWSPPAFMKDNNHMLQGGKLKPEFYPAWARYFVKFIEGYAQRGVPVWAVSVQNEPMAKQTWESCIYTAEEELEFIKNHLGPTLHQEKKDQVRIIAWDHNRDLIYQRAATYLHDKKAANYIWGIGFHWYEIWNGMRQYDNVRRVYEAFPDHKLLLTEACNYPFDWKTFEEWQWGENYGENMIQDFNNGAVAWTDWNVLLDETGGPNHVGNFCFAPVHAKTDQNTLHLMNSYYYIGHFSKFIEPGAKRIAVSSNRGQLLTTAFQNPDGKIIVMVMNKTEESYTYEIIISGLSSRVECPPRSIATLVLSKSKQAY